MAKKPAKKSAVKSRRAPKKRATLKPKGKPKAAKKPVAKKKPAAPKRKAAVKRVSKKAAKAKAVAKKSPRKAAKRKATAKKRPIAKRPHRSQPTTKAKTPAKAKPAPEKPQTTRSTRTQYEVPPQVQNEKLSRSQIREFRIKLETEGARLIQEVGRLENQNFENVPGDQSNRFGNHLADVASDSQILETLLVQSGMEAERLRQINEALERIDRRKYGICERCGANIGYDRLLAKPFARFCIVCREHMERGMQRITS